MVSLRTVLFAAALLAVAMHPYAPRPAAAGCATALCSQEALYYNLRWGVFPVGSAELTSTPREDDCLRRVAARSNLLVDLVAKVRDEIVARARCEDTAALHYAKTLHEGELQSRYHVRFEHGVAFRTDELTGGVVTRNVGRVIDPVSVLFVFRGAMFPAEGHVASRVVSDGTVLVQAWAKFVGRERLHMVDGFVETQVFDVCLGAVDGFFRLAEGEVMRIWVTDDSERIPVKIQARVVVAGFEGEFTGVLTRAVREGQVVLQF